MLERLSASVLPENAAIYEPPGFERVPVGVLSPCESCCHVAATLAGDGRERWGMNREARAAQACVVIAGTRDG
jgi:hypothetical protein